MYWHYKRSPRRKTFLRPPNKTVLDRMNFLTSFQCYFDLGHQFSGNRVQSIPEIIDSIVQSNPIAN
jgi:hypothetical protein